MTWFEEIFEEYNRKSSYYFVVLRVSVSFLSFNSSVISDACATSLLWVTTMTHLPVFWASDLSSSTISPAVLGSRFPVGSSARITGASETKLRAMATRCCWPPDNWRTFRLIWLSSKPSSISVSCLPFCWPSGYFPVEKDNLSSYNFERPGKYGAYDGRNTPSYECPLLGKG